MAYASRLGRARVNARSPQAAAICQRCGFVYNRVDIRYQYDWTGTSLQNLRVLVCDRCYDEPQEQSRSIVIPADPVPIINPSPEFYTLDETDYATLTPKTIDPVTGLPIPNTTVMTTVVQGDFNSDFSSDFNVLSSGDNMSMQPIGRPKGYTQNAQSPLVAGSSYAVKLPVISMIAAGTTIITVTTSSAHGLSASSQVAVQGISNAQAAGAYSVSAINSATQFVYETQAVIPAGSLLMPHTLVTTMNIGIPLTMTQLPQTGP